MAEAMSHEAEEILDHEYDGIHELDNRLPRWWLSTLWITVAFSFVYWAYFHVFDVGASSMQAFEGEMAEAERIRQEREAALEKAGGGVTDDTLLALSHDPEAVARGKAAFDTNCAACHRGDGGGLIGPNLTDAYFLHGDKPTDTYKVVSEGVPAKGMPAWKPMLGTSGTRDVVAFVLSLRGKNVPDGKAPQGEQGTLASRTVE